jgi:hypothetical protein
LRARPETIQLAAAGGTPITIRVQLAEAWDMVRVNTSAHDSVETVKICALEILDPSAGSHNEYVITNRGIKILDEGQSLASAGVVNGATLLIEQRHRRPVR